MGANSSHLKSILDPLIQHIKFQLDRLTRLLVIEMRLNGQKVQFQGRDHRVKVQNIGEWHLHQPLTPHHHLWLYQSLLLPLILILQPSPCHHKIFRLSPFRVHVKQF